MLRSSTALCALAFLCGVGVSAHSSEDGLGFWPMPVGHFVTIHDRILWHTPPPYPGTLASVRPRS